MITSIWLKYFNLLKKGLPFQKEKCSLNKPEVKWFGNIYSAKGMLPDAKKWKIVQEWPGPKRCAEIKSFQQTTQFNAKFLSGKCGELSFP